MTVRVAIDVGGTFTDLCALDEETGELRFIKDSTTPANFAVGVIRTFQRSGLRGEQVTRFIGTGSTMVINALTERKGAKTAVITTKGFRDVLEIQRSNRTDMYNFRYEKPKPFVPRSLIYEVQERVNYRGDVLKPLRRRDVYRAARACRAQGVESVAVCLYNSYANPGHELACETIFKQELPFVGVTLSHVLTREWREYERTNTAVLNAFVQPVVEHYLRTLNAELSKAGVRIPLHVMQSNGGVSTLEQAVATPIYQVESGPIGGVIGATVLGQAIGEANLVSLDVGGTTAKTSLVDRGEIKVTTDYRVARSAVSSGHPIKVPVVDIVEIGAGGGSIAWINEVGVLNVGPMSAGAEPGPACYDRGGTKPTVTDAFLLAGVINPRYFLGGEIALDATRAKEACEPLARHFGMEVVDLALGVVRLASANMINALKLVSVRRGYDPRDFTMVAFGGGGPMFASALCAELGIRRVVVPRVPGVFSAWGMLLTDLRHDYLQTKVMRLSAESLSTVDDIFAKMEEQALVTFREERVAESEIIFQKSLDIRYAGQEHTVKVPVPSSRLGAIDLPPIEGRFHELHEKAFTFRLADPLEVVNIHLAAFGRVVKPTLTRWERAGGTPQVAGKEERMVEFPEQGLLRTTAYERDLLPVDAEVRGPAIIEEPTATTVLQPRDRGTVDHFGNLIIAVGGPA